MPEITQISIYGKGGVGKSTITTNLAICLAEAGEKPMLVGCSPKSDSTTLLLGGKPATPVVLDNIQAHGSSKAVVQECVHFGYGDVACLEAGGPPPASGCAGRGIYHTLRLLKQHNTLEENEITYAIYDAIADVVCGGFSLPMRKDFASTVYIVTTAEMMSLYAANNISNAALAVNSGRPDAVQVGGLILSGRDIPAEKKIVQEFADLLGLPVIAYIPYSAVVQKAGARKGTVMEHFPESNLAEDFRDLAAQLRHPHGITPRPIPPLESLDLITDLIYKHQATNDAPAVRKTTLRPAVATTHANALPLRRIAIYGKAGVGKSTTSSNLSAALAAIGRKVLQVGCDPKRDSVAQLVHCLPPTILEQMNRQHKRNDSADNLALEDVFFDGYNGVVCAEAGGPPPGVGCAGQGVLLALQFIEERDVITEYGIDFSLFDVLGDVVCGGFAQPIRAGYCREIYVIVNGEPLSLVVTNNILRAVEKLNREGINVGLGGLINNQSNAAVEEEIVLSYAQTVGVPIIGRIPRSPLVQAAEARRQTVMEAFPDSHVADLYRQLAQDILDNDTIHTPRAIQDNETIFDLAAAFVPANG